MTTPNQARPSGLVRSDSRTSQLSRRVRHRSLQDPPSPQRQYRESQEESRPSISGSMRSVGTPPVSSPRTHRRRILSNPIGSELSRSPPGAPGATLANDPAPNSEPPSLRTNSTSARRPGIPDLGEHVPPSPGSIASTAITPSLVLKRQEMEERLREDMQRNKVPLEPIISADELRNGLSKGNKSPHSVSEQDRDSKPLPPAFLQREASGSSNSIKPQILSPSHSRASQRSHKSSAGLLPSPKPSHHTPDASIELRENTATPLSYAPAQETVNQPSPQSSLQHPTRQYHETPTNTVQPSTPPKAQRLKVDTDGLRESASSVTASPRRSVPGHESPEVAAVAATTTSRGLDASPRASPSSPTLMIRQQTPTIQRRYRGGGSNQGPSPGGTKSSIPSSKPESPALQETNLELYYDQTAVENFSGLMSPSLSSKSGVSEPAQALLIANNTPPKRTLDLVRSQVAREMAFRAVSKSNVADGVRIGVADASSASSPDDIPFIHLIASSLSSSFKLSSSPYLFIITTAASFGGTPPSPIPGILYITSSSRQMTARAIQLVSSKLVGRVALSSYTFSSSDNDSPDGLNLGLATKEQDWMARIKDLHVSSFDSDIIHSILLSASRAPLDPSQAPPNSKSIDTILKEARAQLQRITARQAFTELRNNVMDVPTVLVDIRPQAQREEKGTIEGALIVERNVLEWRFDPRCEARLAVADRYDLRVIVFCQEGYTSSLAALSLQQLGLLNATDMIGGYKAWKDAKLPVLVKPPRERSIASAAGSIV